MKHQNADVIVVGAGPAGLTAGMCSANYGLRTLILEEKIPGGCAAEIPRLENYPGYGDGITGSDLIDNMVQQCEKSGVEIQQLEKVTELNLTDDEKVIKTDKSVYNSEAVILAMGRSHNPLEIPGEKELRGRGVSYCAVCDGHFFKDKKVVIVGYDNRAAEVALYLSAMASDVKIICQGKALCVENVLVKNLEKQNIEMLGNMELKEIKGDVNVQSIILADSNSSEAKEITTDGVFFQLDDLPNSQIAAEAGIKVDDNGYILVDNTGQTNVRGVYAVGDITTCPTKLVVTAVSQAAVAAIEIFRYVNRLM